MAGDRPSRFPTDAVMRALLASAFTHLPPMERNVMRRRLGLHAPGDPWSLTKTAHDLGITIDKTRVIEHSARRRIRNLRDRGLIPPVELPTTTEEGDDTGDDRGAERPTD